MSSLNVHEAQFHDLSEYPSLQILKFLTDNGVVLCGNLRTSSHVLYLFIYFAVLELEPRDSLLLGKCSSMSYASSPPHKL